MEIRLFFTFFSDRAHIYVQVLKQVLHYFSRLVYRTAYNIQQLPGSEVFLLSGRSFPFMLDPSKNHCGQVISMVLLHLRSNYEK